MDEIRSPDWEVSFLRFLEGTLDGAVGLVEQKRRSSSWKDIVNLKIPFDIDDGWEDPIDEVYELSRKAAWFFMDLKALEPDRIYPDANGGIVFTVGDSNYSESIRVWNDLNVELLTWTEGSISSRIDIGRFIKQAREC